MPKYKLRLVEPGDYLTDEGGGPVYVGDTAEEAHDFYSTEHWDDVEWVHPEILRGRVAYARDVENGDCHEEAEPGDTTYDYVTSHPERALGPLRENDVRTWPEGTWRPHWVMRFTGAAWEVKVGDDVIGQYEDRDTDAKAALDAEIAKRIEAWKRAHPEYYRPLPEEPDDA